MAKFGNNENNNQADNNSRQTTSTANEIRNIMAERRNTEYGIREQSFQQRTICCHKPIDGLQIDLQLLAENGGLGGNKMYSKEYTVRCMGSDGCGDTFDMEVYTEEALNEHLYKLYSAAQQIKVMDGGQVELDAQSRDDLRNIIAMFPALSSMIKMYVKVLKKAAGGGKNHKKMKPNGGKGGVGLPTGGMGGGRMY